MSHRVRRFDWDDSQYREGVVLERNGNLVLVEDEETGDVDWHTPQERDDDADD